uniref:Queuine tRNA-ribosyltransferase catalytic subunit 1 n=1 Tax=Chromera velia CCMP2878 TaxID=1169474 RepID=A0A0G4I7T1_9ALVE|eukprot:Cvel_11773.t1-p1 / transcript=Cvel_11773.t1 / gene=Cvel_11773 / organism=Chromera_velia_CCMP2878 / gene_product=Queuine tRNA-ribosyltransferase, putative / transcript_product=Queuine tRNA-ribosyltransferase, putative / location=Cvel_scaffold748:62905-68892(-) / protein_length=536 / sequence_SO=supercontig / SO=protein_coding / is_pseudo=false
MGGDRRSQWQGVRRRGRRRKHTNGRGILTPSFVCTRLPPDGQPAGRGGWRRLQRTTLLSRSSSRTALPPPPPPLSSPPDYSGFSFTTDFESKTDRSRTGLLETPHGTVETPNFIFCATKAAIKGLNMEQMKDAGTQFILSNTYHLFLNPGPEIVESRGGLQSFTGWRGPMLTDSGGYQIFSMGHGSVSEEIKGKRQEDEKKGATLKGKIDAKSGEYRADAEKQPSSASGLLKISEHGAKFRSYVNGSIKELTPEVSIQAQRSLGADIILVLDECTPFRVTKEYTEGAMKRSHRWAFRSLSEFVNGQEERRRSGRPTQALYGIVQGGVYPSLRKESCEFNNEHPFFGVAIGGSLGADKRMMRKTVAVTCRMLRRDRPIHLLGVGGVRDIFHGVANGIDTFDCVHPTRLGRHGGALVKRKFWEEGLPPTSKGKDSVMKVGEHFNVAKGLFKHDDRPIDSECGCATCRNYSRAYLHHCFKSGELVGGSLVAQHNVYFMNELMASIRAAIRENRLEEEKAKWVHPDLEQKSALASFNLRT